MTLKDKIIYIFISIITFGIYWLIIKRNKNSAPTKELSMNNKVSIDLKKLISYLGGKDNIFGTEYTQNKVKIFIKNREITNIQDIDKITGISGIVVGAKYITIIVGKQAKAIAEKL